MRIRTPPGCRSRQASVFQVPPDTMPFSASERVLGPAGHSADSRRLSVFRVPPDIVIYNYTLKAKDPKQRLFFNAPRDQNEFIALEIRFLELRLKPDLAPEAELESEKNTN